MKAFGKILRTNQSNLYPYLINILSILETNFRNSIYRREF